MCPITTVSSDRATPSWWKSSSSEIPKTTYGITSGLSSSAETAGLAQMRLRVSASEARMPRITAPVLENAATIALVCSAPRRSPFEMKSRYQRSVKPESGKLGTGDLLNENTSRIAIGAYRKTTTSVKNTRSSRFPFGDSATSITPRPPGEAGGSARRRP